MKIDIVARSLTESDVHREIDQSMSSVNVCEQCESKNTADNQHGRAQRAS